MVEPQDGVVLRGAGLCWQPNTRHMDRIELREMPDASAQLAAFLAGQIPA